jgi:hypothetical protein
MKQYGDLIQRIQEMAKPRTLPKLDHEKIIAQLKDKIHKAIKQEGYHNTQVDHYKDTEGNHHITAEHGLGTQHYIEDLIREHPNTKITSSQHHHGSFDWASDTYIKDQSDIGFSLKHK